ERSPPAQAVAACPHSWRQRLMIQPTNTKTKTPISPPRSRPSSSAAPANTSSNTMKIALIPRVAGGAMDFVGKRSLIGEDLDKRLAALVEARTMHARSIEAPGGMAASVHDNDAAVAMDGAQFGEHLLARALGAFMPQLHARADIARDADAD